MELKALLYCTKAKPYLIKRNVFVGVEPSYFTLKENVENNPIAVQDYLYWHRRKIKGDMFCIELYIDTIDKALADIYSGRL